MYPEELIERLLPAIWDDSAVAWGFDSDTTPDPDMPKAKYVDPRRATDQWCHVIDIRRAWSGARLNGNERVAIKLYYLYGLTQQEIADVEHISKKTINKRIKSGLAALSDYLNV